MRERVWMGVACLGAMLIAPAGLLAQTPLQRARAEQRQGRMAELRAAATEVLERATDPATLAAAAALLDETGARHGIEAYQRVLAAGPAARTAEAQAARRRLVLLYLEAGQPEQAARLLEDYRRYGGDDLALWSAAAPSMPATGYIEIPGPLLGFQRMAALKPATRPEELVRALARNIVTFGYQYSYRSMRVAPTEYLKLLKAYLGHARELQALAGAPGVLRVSACEQAGPLLALLGYRRRGPCVDGRVDSQARDRKAPPQALPPAAIEVDNSTRAFLAADSGFPLVELEEAVQGKQPFEHSVRPARVPVLFGPEAWLPSTENWIDEFVSDRELARLYLGLSQLDSATAELLFRSVGPQKLKAVAHVLDFFGSSLRVENGRAVAPGGPAAARVWGQLAGANPDHPAAFFVALLQKDEGWLAAYFDALSRASPAAQAYLCEANRLARFYRALRGRTAVPGPARPIFRSSAQLLLLTARLRLRPDGTAYLPGGVNTWKAVFRLRPARLPGFKKPGETSTPQTADQVVEGLFARVRDAEENGALNVFLVVNEMDRRRSRPLASDTILLLTAQYPRFSQHYHVFVDWPQLSDAAIEQTIDVYESLGRIRDPMTRADAIGALQAAMALLDIQARQNEIPEAKLDEVYQRLLSRFANVEEAERVFTASREAVQLLLSFAPTGTGSQQERMIGMLAAPPGIAEEARPVRDEVASRIRSGLEAQRLIPLDALFELADQLESAARTGTPPGAEFSRLAERIQNLRLPNLFPSTLEKQAAFFGYWAERHIMAERENSLDKMVRKEKPAKLGELRGLLLPHLRDTLVGLVYAYYAPPGSALLLNNPLFVRSHDFLGISGRGTGNEIWGPGRVSGPGWPLSAGGRFSGSLSGIAYALADAEKDFLVPQQTQSLIWGELVPQLLLGSTLPRWWQVSPRTQHWAALNLRLGRDLLAEAAVSPEARRAIVGALHLPPLRGEQVERDLARGDVPHALRLVMPAELYRLARTALSGAPAAGLKAAAPRAGPLAAVIEQMERDFPEEASEAAASAAYGVPHPKLTRSYRPELLQMSLFPALMGYSSRLLAETWESTNLYWAELADELALHPSELNRLAPQLTRRTLERVFANDLEDWPALLHAMLATGEEFRAQAANDR